MPVVLLYVLESSKWDMLLFSTLLENSSVLSLCYAMAPPYLSFVNMVEWCYFD